MNAMQVIQAGLYTEIREKGLTDACPPDPEVLQDMPLLTAVIYESLRLFPPIGQLVNRKASKDLLLGGDIAIPKGTYLGYNCYSTNRDPAAWGSTADCFEPGRWGDSIIAIQKHYRARRVRAEFISFHGGRRACLGEKFAMLQLRVTIVTLAQAFTWKLDPSWVDRKTPVSINSPEPFMSAMSACC
jgi:cytochrome P450